MKMTPTLLIVSILFSVASTLMSQAHANESASLLIETTKNAKIRPDYEIVEGEDEISGDPTAGTKAAYASWKEACKEWKKELKENNKGDRVLVSNCGSASFQKDEASGTGAGVYVYRSKAKYKIRVRIRD